MAGGWAHRIATHTRLNRAPQVRSTNPGFVWIQAPAPPAAAEEAKPLTTTSSVFSMFGGGAKKEKKEEERGDNSGSAKSQREAAAASKGDEVRFCPQWRCLARTAGEKKKY